MGVTDRVLTGIHGLDSQLGGGVPPGTSLLLIADSGNALYQFLQEVAYYGMEQGQSVLWFELDRPWPLVKRSLHPPATAKKGELTVFHAYEPRLGDRATNGSGVDMKEVSAKDVQALVAEVMSQVEPDNYRLIFTSLTSLLETQSPKEVLGLLRQVVALGQTLGGLQIFTLIRGVHPEDQVTMFKHACTGVFELAMERKGFGLYSYLKIEKLLGVRDAARLLLFNETENGIRFESTRRVF